jgi:anoctamin-10
LKKSWTDRATEKAQAEAQFVKLIQALTDVGLATEVRNGDNCALLIFVRVASARHLDAEVYRSRVLDWLYGVRLRAPEKQIRTPLGDEPVTDAERLRLVYLLITKPSNEGGAGITPKQGEWSSVESIFALHDHSFNRNWIMQWSTKYLLSIDDLTTIKNRFGEKIGFYFAFLQSYFIFLVFPAAFGLSCWLLLGRYALVYAIVNCLSCVVFIEYWRKQEVDLAFQWNVRGVSKIQHNRPQFIHEATARDPITGEEIKVYSPLKRLAKQLLQIPFAVVAAILLGGLIVTCFAIEIFISEVYDGPFKAYLVSSYRYFIIS